MRDEQTARFRLARVHPGEWLSGLTGLALVVGLLLPWAGDAAALDSPGLLDVLLLLLALGGLLLPAVVAFSRRTNVPIVFETGLWTMALLLGLVLLVKLLLPPDGGHETGFWVSLAATLALGFSLWRNVGRED